VSPELGCILLLTFEKERIYEKDIWIELNNVDALSSAIANWYSCGGEVNSVILAVNFFRSLFLLKSCQVYRLHP
jgi:hypothetical protein